MLSLIKTSISISLISLFCTSVVFARAGSLKAPSVYANGIFVTEKNRSVNVKSRVSENGRFLCQFDIGVCGPTTRELINCRFFQDGAPTFTMAKVPGSDISISNAGYVLVYDHRNNGKYSLTIHCFSKSGTKLFSKRFERADLFGFSPRGNMLGVGSNNGLEVVALSTGRVETYRRGWKFDISYDETTVAIAYEKGVAIYSQGKLVGDISTGMMYTRNVKISPDNMRVALIDKRNLQVYSIPACQLAYADVISGANSFRDLRLDNMTVWTGIHHKGEEYSKGILKTHNLLNKSGIEEIKIVEPRIRSGLDVAKFRAKYGTKTRDNRYPTIPWPFRPQDESHELWNNYEGFNSYADGAITADYPYLHQGVDLECDRNTRTYAVKDGVVKCRLTTGGDIYWRIATAEQQVSGTSDGWLYAHLIESTIQVDVGDQVQTGDYIAQIIYWSTQVDAHLHFARITDRGTVWSYSDDEWGITYNPELSITPNNDSTPPVIVSAINNKSKFGYCRNNTGYNANSSDYYYPDSARGGLTGDVDIIVNLYDYIEYKNFTQPAYAVYYWIKGIDRINCWSNYNKLIIDTTLGQERNHFYSFYLASKYKPYSEVIFKADNVFEVGGWFNRTRRFAHFLTNTNGDTLITKGEKDSCLHTADYYDGWYRVYVKATDCKGNFVIDSEDVYFDNGNHDPTPIANEVDSPPEKFYLGHTIPGQSSALTNIKFSIPKFSIVSLRIYDLLGNEIKTLAAGFYRKGKYNVTWDGSDNRNKQVGAGIYVYTLKADNLTATRKMQLLK